MPHRGSIRSGVHGNLRAILDSPKYYWENLRRWPEKFAKVFHAMADAPQGAIVVHCAGGRDRTGMITMMLLLLAGVEHNDIAVDYELSVRAVNEYFNSLPATNARETPRSESDLRAALRPRGKALRTLMARFDVERYLLNAGLTASELETLKGRLRA